MEAWRRRLHQRADVAPLRERETLVVAGADVGSIEPSLGERLVAAGLPIDRRGGAWTVADEADPSLARIAAWLHEQRLGGAWRDELLPVCDAQGHRVTAVERAAVRPLGIATQAVHLVGWCEGRRAMWVQQRAFDKSTDPGLWDTLAGGLIAANETVDSGLERETWEEAGLRLDALREVAPLGRAWVRRPVAQGYMVEAVEMFEALVPNGRVPENHDGEVERFEVLELDELQRRLLAEQFTLEASLVIEAAWPS